jgi:hypothetical protein
MQSAGLQILSFVGAILILTAYIGHQFKWIRQHGAAYNIMNVVGSGILAYIALRPFQLGFVVLESTWAVVSLLALLRPRRPETSAGGL